MGSKNGTWVPSYQSFDDHPKTATIVAALVEMGVPESFACDVAFGQWKRLGFFLLSQGTDGRLLAITPRTFAHIVRWDDVKRSKYLWDAWMQSGFIDEPGTPNARLHDFREAFGHIIAARERSATRRAERYPTEDTSSQTVRELSANDSQTIYPSRVRASGAVRTGPTPLPPTSISPPAELGGVANGHRFTKSDPPASADGSRAAEPGDGPVAAAWDAARARRGLPPQPRTPQFAAALDCLANAVPRDTERQAGIAAAYVALDDPWLAARGWAPRFLVNRLDGLIATRTRALLDKPALPLEESLVLPAVPGATREQVVRFARPASQPFTPDEIKSIGEAIRAAEKERPDPGPRWSPHNPSNAQAHERGTDS